jgi:hypothetical protein
MPLMMSTLAKETLLNLPSFTKSQNPRKCKDPKEECDNQITGTHRTALSLDEEKILSDCLKLMNK